MKEPVVVYYKDGNQHNKDPSNIVYKKKSFVEKRQELQLQLYLYYLKGFSVKQLAKRFNLNVKLVRKLLQREEHRHV